ncbi:MAG: MFS transporter [Pseudomonadota bacterium]
MRAAFLILLLWVTGLLAGGQFAKVSVLLPEMRALYPEQREQIAWLLTVVSIVGAIFGGYAGSFANRMGQKRVLVVSLCAAGGLSVWQSTHPAFGVMALSRVLEGVTHLGLVVTAPALMAQLSSDRWRGQVMALWSTFFGVSFALFAWFGIPLAEEFGAGALFQIHGLCLLAIALPCQVFLPRPAAVSGVAETRATTPLAFYRDVRIIWPGVGWLFYTFTFLALLTILPSQMPGGVRAPMTAMLSLIGIGVSLLIVPLVLTRLSATSVVLLGFFFAVLATPLGSAMTLGMLGVMLFAILGMIQGGSFAAVAELNGSLSRRTLGYGFMAQTGNLGNLVGTPALFAILGASGFGGMLSATTGIYVVGFLSLAYLARRMGARARAT